MSVDEKKTEKVNFDKEQSFDSVSIVVAHPTTIKSWSKGEVKNPETINYRIFKPEPGGLFCQKIFGPVRDYECACGKYKRIKYKGVICDRCGVEVTLAGIERLTFTADNMPAIERKMREERNGVATSISLEARKQASKISNESKRAVAEIQSAAEAEAIEIRGVAQARVKEIEAESLALDPDLFEFQRTLEVAEQVLRDGTLVIGTDHPLLKIFDVLLGSTSAAGGEPDDQ